jgi:2-dehydro-3-deoxyphosphooctonate aldolase (KDO 8-P synthase)
MQSYSLVPSIKNIGHRTSNNFFLIAGPCAIESEQMAMEIAEKVKRITSDLKIPMFSKALIAKRIGLLYIHSQV